MVVIVIAAPLARVRPSADGRRPLLAAAACWFAGGYALTLFLPVRSSLYAVFPSVGAAIACGAIVESIATNPEARRAWTAIGATLAAAALALSPVYSVRNDRWVEPARLSQRTLRIIAPRLHDLSGDGAVVLADEPAVEPTFTQAFGVFECDAIQLETGRAFDGWIDPPPPDWQLAGLRRPAAVAARFELHHGAVIQTAR